MNLLIIDERADYVHSVLGAKFPGLVIHAAKTEAEAEAFVQDAHILIAIRASDELIKKAEKLQWIQSLISGVDFFIQLPSLRKEVLITSCRGIHGPQMSEHAFLLMLALNRNLLKVFKNQERAIWERWPGKLLLHKKVGILGVGVIGKELARKCKAFGMVVHGLTSVKRDIEFVDHSYGPDELRAIFSEVDYLINILPSLPQTQGVIGAEEFAVMKPSAYFINIGRGETVDEDALIQTLKSGKIAGAGLDVFEREPLPKDSPLWGLENVIITSHIGGLSDIYIDQVLPTINENLGRYLNGERRDLVNFIEWQQ